MWELVSCFGELGVGCCEAGEDDGASGFFDGEENDGEHGAVDNELDVEHPEGIGYLAILGCKTVILPSPGQIMDNST